MMMMPYLCTGCTWNIKSNNYKEEPLSCVLWSQPHGAGQFDLPSAVITGDMKPGQSWRTTEEELGVQLTKRGNRKTLSVLERGNIWISDVSSLKHIHCVTMITQGGVSAVIKVSVCSPSVRKRRVKEEGESTASFDREGSGWSHCGAPYCDLHSNWKHMTSTVGGNTWI